MIVKRKLYSNSNGIYSGNNKDKSFLIHLTLREKILLIMEVSAGKTGLAIAGGLGAASLAQAGRAVSYTPGLVKDFKDVMALRKNKEVRNMVKSEIRGTTAFIPVPGLSDQIINKLRNAEGVYNNTKFSTLDRIQKGYNILNQASNQSRTTLYNAGDWAKIAKGRLLKSHPTIADNKNVVKVMDRGADEVGRFGKAALNFKNAKLLGRSALAVAGVSGAAYLHGKELKSYRNRTTDNN